MSTPQETLIVQKDYTRATDWDNAGFTGTNVKIYNTENLGGSSSHGTLTTDMLFKVSKDVEVINGEMAKSFSNNKMIKFDVKDTDKNISFHEFIDKYRPKLITCSIMSDTYTDDYIEYVENIRKKYDVIINCLAGNYGLDGDESLAPSFHPSSSILWGAANIVNGKPQRAQYSSVGKELDFMSFTGFQTGTSFSTPFGTALEAKILQRYGNMCQEEMYKYLQFCAEDMGVSGVDNLTGWGLVRLPEVSKKYITLKVGNKKYHVDGKELESDVSPVNNEGNVFVPLRVIGEALGKTFKTQSISNGIIDIEINDGLNTVQMQTGSIYMFINGKKSILNFAPYLVNNRTLVPVRAISKAFGCKVDWIQNEKKVMILEG